MIYQFQDLDIIYHCEFGIINLFLLTFVCFNDRIKRLITDTWRRHASPRGRLHGRLRVTNQTCWRLMGPQVNGPRLEGGGAYLAHEGDGKAKGASHFYTRHSPLFFFVWHYVPFLYLQVTWEFVVRRIKLRGSTRVNSVDFDPPDPHQKHLHKCEPSIA